MRVRFLTAVCVFLSWLASASAHRLDEYLQATLVEIAPDSIRLRINLTPGTAVADEVLGKIDTDHDGAISELEIRKYAELVSRDLDVRVDGRAVALTIVESSSDDIPELRDGFGMIKVEFSGSPGTLAGGAHEVTFQNRHLPAISTYLVNATKPQSHMIEITAQKRSPSQNVSKIEFLNHSPPVAPNSNLGTAFLAAGVVLALTVTLWRLSAVSESRLHGSNV